MRENGKHSAAMASSSRRSGISRNIESTVRVRKYKAEEINLIHLADLAEEKLGRRPFDWQLEAASALLQGEDLVLDVGTGNGKTLVFSLPLLLDSRDINIIVSPLSALMIDQVRHVLLSSSICGTHPRFSPRRLLFPLLLYAARQLLMLGVISCMK